MPFAVFRQHQRKMLAVLAILAMGGFVLSDSLSRWPQAGARSRNDYEVAMLFDRPIRLSDISDMSKERAIANQFMAGISGNPQFFGGNTQDELIDAMILQHEADRLEIPATPDFAKRWVDQVTRGQMNDLFYRTILSRFATQQISSDQLLTTLAKQVRIFLAQAEVALPLVTPLDVYQNYRDQTERASFKAVPFVVDSFTAKVGQPTDADVQKLYDEGKDVLPDPTRVAPGFKVPRKIRVEYVAADSNALAREIRAKLPEADLVAYYESRQKDFPLDGRELPIDIFLGEPNLTPPRYQALSEVRETLADALSRTRASEQINDLFEKVSAEVIDPFDDAYRDAQDELRDAQREARSTAGITLPTFKDGALQAAATKYNLRYDASPLMDQSEAEKFGEIARATLGTGTGARGKDFDHALFDTKPNLYEGKEFGDVLGARYLVRKLADEPAHVAPLSEIRDRVVRAWKVAQARPLARKAADDYAARLKGEGAVIRSLTVDDRPVLSIDETTKLKPGVLMPPVGDDFRFQRGPASPTEIRQIPEAGPALLDALFALNPGQVAVEPDRPETTFYVMVLDNRRGVGYSNLMGPGGGYAGFQTEAAQELRSRSLIAGMKRLRDEAHYRETKVGTALEEGRLDRRDESTD